MDYKDNFHTMIARYNRELLETYRRQNPPSAEVEATPVVAVTEKVPSLPNNTVPNPTALGVLEVWVTTASSALPLSGAHVTVSYDTPDGRTVQYIGVTDESGRTAPIPLPAVGAEESLSQEGAVAPFTLYNVEVFADRYYRVENIGVPMYGGVRAVLPVRMIPLPEGIADGELVYRDSAPQGLEERA